MIQGSCHCGTVRWSFEGTPESATVCNCTACRRYGALWAYGFEGNIQVSGSTQTYTRGRWVVFHFCAGVARDNGIEAEHCGEKRPLQVP